MAIVMRSGEIRRYDANERLNHWAVAILFVLLAASGLAFFHPAFWFLSVLLGGGTWARILHPFLGVLMFVLFFVMAMRYWNDNKIQPYDREWGKRLSDVINNRDDNLPAIDKYNVGQKQLFWTMVGHDGLADRVRHRHVATVFRSRVPDRADSHRGGGAHAVRAFMLILGIIVHVYAGVILGTRFVAGDDARHGVACVGPASSSAVVPAHDGR